MNDADMLDEDPFMPEEFDTSPYDGYGQSGPSSSGESQFTLNIENAAIEAGLSQSPDMPSFHGDNYHGNAGIMADNQGISCPFEYPRFMSQDSLCVAPGQLLSPKGTSSLGVSADPPVYPDLPVACDALNSHNLGTTTASPQSSSSLQPARRKEKPGNRPCDVNKEKRKTKKPLKCLFCPERKPWNRDLKRHYITWHPEKARHMGLDTSRVSCPVHDCKKTFARQDHCARHLRKQHGQ